MSRPLWPPFSIPPSSRDTVPVRVRLGETNLATASGGAIAQHASATCDGRTAALRAAAKYFRCREVDIELTLIEQGNIVAKKPARYMASRKGGAS